MGLIKITSTMTEAERIAAYNSNMQYLEKDLPLKCLPVGIVISFDTPVDPNKLYGGKWERIKGRFIWSIEDGEQAGCTGGEKTHTLNNNEIPSHNHNIPTTIHETEHSGNKDKYTYGGWSNSYGMGGVEYSGGGQPHNNMPPYYGAYTWRRVS